MLTVPPSRHPDQLEHILEGLAQIHQVETVPIVRYMRQEAKSLPWGSTLLVISAQPDEALAAALLDLKRVGRSVTLVTIGANKEVLENLNTGRMPVFNVSDEFAWDVVEKIGLNKVEN
jgi:hypothetical protein